MAARLWQALIRRLRSGDGFEADARREQAVLAGAARSLSIAVTDHGNGLLEFARDGRRTFIRHNTTGVESAISHKIAGDKALVQSLLSEAGLPVPPFRWFARDAFPEAARYARELDGPVVVKPRRGTSGGAGVTVAVSGPRDFRAAFCTAGFYGPDVLVERYVAGRNIRLLMVEGILLSAVERIPPMVTGNGRDTIRTLISRENAARRARTAPPRLWPIPVDRDLRDTLADQGLNLTSRPDVDRRVVLNRVVNGHKGAVVEEITHCLHPGFVAMAERAMAVCGIAFAGVDMLAADFRRAPAAGAVVINELNTNPSFYGHYQAVNRENRTDPAAGFLNYLFDRS